VQERVWNLNGQLAKNIITMATRVQVQDLPDAPRLQATVQSGGNYGVAVQQAGRNKLMDLADSLSSFNEGLKQYGALGQLQGQIGAEEALTVSDADVLEEIRKTEPDTFLSIQRNKAYRNTLLKRAVTNNLLPSMQAASDDLLDLEQYKTQGAFLEAVDGFMKDQWSSFSEEVGQEAASSDGAKVLWNAVTSPFKADMLKAYDKKMDDFIVNGQTEELGLQLDALTRRRIDPTTGQLMSLDTVGLQQVAQQREKLLKEAGINDPKDRSKILVNAFAKQVDALIAVGRFTDADRMLGAMDVMSINNKPIFRTTDAKTVTTPLVSKLRTAFQSSSKDTLARQGRRFSNRVVSTMLTLRTGAVNRSATNEMEDTFQAMGASAQQAEQLIESIKRSESPIGMFYETLRTLANDENASDDAYNLFYDNLGTINKGFEDAQLSPLPPSALNRTTRENEVKEFTRWKSKPENMGRDASDWIKETNKDYRLVGFTELIKANEETTKGDYVVDLPVYKDVEQLLDTQLDKVTDEDGQYPDLPTALSKEFAITAIPFIKKRLQEKAREVANLQPEERDKALRDERAQAIIEEQERFKKRAEAFNSIIKVGAQVNEPSKINKEGDAVIDKPFIMTGDFEYSSLKALDAAGSNRRKAIEGTLATEQDIQNDRIEMKKNEHKASYRRSLYNYGYSEFNPAIADELETYEMDADDVKLFKDKKELRIVSAGWAGVLNKDLNRETLTAEETDTKELYQKFGIYDDVSFQEFFNKQDILLPN